MRSCYKRLGILREEGLHRDNIRKAHSYLSLELKYLHEEVLFLGREPPHGYTSVCVFGREASSPTAIVRLKTLLHLHIGITESSVYSLHYD